MSKFPAMPTEVIETMSRRPVDIGSPFGKCDLHHAIISKGMITGLPDREKVKIHDPRNLLKVEHSVHLSKPLPSPIRAARMLSMIYGKSEILEWLRSIEWRYGIPRSDISELINQLESN